MSAPICPECQADLEDDFGLVECGSCGAQVLIGDEVVVASSAAEELVDEELAEEPVAEPAVALFEELEEESVEEDPNEFNSGDEELSDEYPVEDLSAEEPQEEYVEEVPDFMAEDTEEGQDTEDQNPLGDIEAFANEELSAEGSLIYDLTIEGIDTPEIRNALVEILKDSKFQWDIEELVASIKLGVLNIYSLNPVKAYLVVTQARRLPIKLAWKQRSIV